MFFDTICTTGAMTMGVLVYVPWGMSLISYVNAYLIAFSLNIFTQIIIAFYSDRVVTKYGRRKPFVILSNVLRYVAFLCLAHPPLQTPTGLSNWFTTFYTLYMVSNAIGTNPFASWFIESTFDQIDYTRVYSVAFPLGGVLGGLLGLGLLEVSPSTASIVAMVGGIFFTLVMLIFVPAKVYRASPQVPDMIPSIRICLQSLEFRKIFTVNVCFNAAMGILGSTQVSIFCNRRSLSHSLTLSLSLSLSPLVHIASEK
jgi:glycoside/pentoside/hexuronide:cation symporter, GPH family